MSRLFMRLTGVVVARYLGASAFGEYAAALALALMVQNAYDFGTNPMMVRDASMNPGRTPVYLGNNLLSKGVLLFPAFSATIALAFVLGYSSRMIVLVSLAFLFAVFQMVAQAFFAVFRVWQRMELQGLIETMAGASIFLAVLASPPFLRSAEVVLILHWAAYVVVCLAAAAVVLRWFRPTFSIRGIAALRDTHWFMWNHLSSMVLIQAPVIFLSTMSGATQAGEFQAAYQLVTMTFLLATAASMAIDPGFYRMAVEERAHLRTASKRLLGLFAGLGAPIAIGMWFVAGPIVSFVYGEAFAEAAGLLKLLVWVALPRFVAIGCGIVLLAIGRERILTAIYVAVALLHLALNFALIGLMDMTGAAIAVLTTEVVLFVACISAVRFCLATVSPGLRS